MDKIEKLKQEIEELHSVLLLIHSNMNLTETYAKIFAQYLELKYQLAVLEKGVTNE